MNKNQDLGNNNNLYDQFINQIKQLLEENKNLKNRIKILENKNVINNNIPLNDNINNGLNMNYLNNDFEKMNNYKANNKKVKTLINQLNMPKNNNIGLTNNNQSLNKEIEQLNKKLSQLENENLNNQQKIYELNNINNILKIKVNSAHSGNFKLNAFGIKR